MHWCAKRLPRAERYPVVALAGRSATRCGSCRDHSQRSARRCRFGREPARACTPTRDGHVRGADRPAAVRGPRGSARSGQRGCRAAWTAPESAMDGVVKAAAKYRVVDLVSAPGPSRGRSSSPSTGRMTIAAELFRRGLSDHRRALIGWCAGIFAYVVLLAAIFPSIEGSPQLSELLDNYPEALNDLLGLSGAVDITKGAGFIDTELFSFMLPLLAIVLAIGSGARTLAGEEDAGRLESVLAYPVSRRRTVAAKAAAVGLEVTIFCAVAFAALAFADPGLRAPAPARKPRRWPSRSRLASAPSRGGGDCDRRCPTKPRARCWDTCRFRRGCISRGRAPSWIAGWLDPFRFLSSFWVHLNRIPRAASTTRAWRLSRSPRLPTWRPRSR